MCNPCLPAMLKKIERKINVIDIQKVICLFYSHLLLGIRQPIPNHGCNHNDIQQVIAHKFDVELRPCRSINAYYFGFQTANGKALGISNTIKISINLLHTYNPKNWNRYWKSKRLSTAIIGPIGGNPRKNATTLVSIC